VRSRWSNTGIAAANDLRSGAGREPGCPRAWRAAAADPAFQLAQDAGRDRVRLDPAVNQAMVDGLGAVGQFSYFDAIVCTASATTRPAPTESAMSR
jgi:hypothetical protein